ncbi:MAG TPA: ZIP family metal transporter [Methylococcaceae bacterium]|nr:ZIP family metal transporter [Methylococcaceae bacterium]
MSLPSIEEAASDIFNRLLRALEKLPIGRALPPEQRRLLLIGVLAVVALSLLGLVYALVSRIVIYGLLASLLAGLATGMGALPTLFFRRISEDVLNVMLGGAAGVMLAATAFSLIVPGVEHGNQLWPGKGVYAVALGLALGVVFLHYAERWLPHEHDFFHVPRGERKSSRKIWLFVLAITLHNFPEGLSVGVSFGGEDWRNGIVLAIAIGLQNIPEGLAVALPLAGLGYSRGKAVGIATLTGLVEPVGGLLGISAVTLFSPLLPLGMGFAAGAMLFVICDGIIPETHAGRNPRAATFGIMAGFLIMTILDNAIR